MRDSQIVKCVECKHRYTDSCALYYGTTNDAIGDRMYFCGSANDDDFYCAMGERGEEDE